MIKDITIGQYFPGETPVHRVDARTKIVLTVWYIVIVFMAKTPAGNAAVFFLLAGLILLSRVSVRVVLKGIKPMLIFIGITAVLNMLYTQGETVLVSWRFIKITLEGVKQAVYMMLRIIFLITGTAMLTYTTSPIMLTDGIERLLSPLRALRFPVHELAMMMSIALRMIPVLIEETDKIMAAQKARGADFESGNLIRRAKALVPMLVPLFVSAFRRAEELATAMESRCYRGGEGRTKYRVARLGPVDGGALALFALVQAAVLILNRLGI